MTDEKEVIENTDLIISERSVVIHELGKNITAIVIEDERQFGKATELLKKIKDQISLIEKKQKDLRSPLNDLLKKISSKFKPVADKASSLKVTLEGKIKNYYELIEEQRRIEAEKKRQEELEKLKQQRQQEAAAAAFLQDDDDEEQESITEAVKEKYDNIIENVEQKEIKINAGFKSGGVATSFVKVPKYEIIDAYEVPIEYQSPDHKKIMEALNLGIRKIDGLRIWEDSQIRSR